uniref:Uncharacterized protein n=1 Tax=Mustela putorius furo TaxID=9669 RepID=M3Z2P6_MUSPF
MLEPCLLLPGSRCRLGQRPAGKPGLPPAQHPSSSSRSPSSARARATNLGRADVLHGGPASARSRAGAASRTCARLQRGGRGRGEGASRPGAGGPQGLAPPPGAAAPARGRRAGPGRQRGPRARALPCSCHLPCGRPPGPVLAGVSESRWLFFKRGSQRNTVTLRFPKTQWGPCVGCGLLEDCWGVRAAPQRPLMGFLPERPKIGYNFDLKNTRNRVRSILIPIHWPQPPHLPK